MDFPKTAEDQCLPLDEQLVTTLREHEQRPPRRRRQESELLFPSRVGGYLARSILDRPFEDVCGKLGLTKRITARGMRRTHQNLMRAANISDAVAMAFSGHETEEMHLHYPSVPEPEPRAAVTKVVRLVDFRPKERAAS